MPPSSDVSPPTRNYSARTPQLIFSDNNSVDGRPFFNIVIVGDNNVGKSSYLRRLVSGEFISEYTQTEGIESSVLLFETCIVNLCVAQCVDGEYQLRMTGQPSGYILMFDEGDIDTLNHVCCVNTMGVPSVFCGMKSDTISGSIDINYIPVSARTTVGMMGPLERLIAQII